MCFPEPTVCLPNSSTACTRSPRQLHHESRSYDAPPRRRPGRPLYQRYQYSFPVWPQPPRSSPPRDQCHSAQAQGSTLHHICAGFKFLAAEDAPALWTPGDNTFDVRTYRVKVREEILPETTVTIALFPIGFPPASDTIHIYDAGHTNWVALEAWLHDAARKDGDSLGHGLQSQWWK